MNANHREKMLSRVASHNRRSTHLEQTRTVKRIRLKLRLAWYISPIESVLKYIGIYIHTIFSQFEFRNPIKFRIAVMLGYGGKLETGNAEIYVPRRIFTG